MLFITTAFLIGVTIGVTVHYTGFCVFGPIAEWFGARSTRRLIGVVAAISVFGLIHFWGFQGNLPCGGIWKGYAGLHSFLGGFIQGIGYVLIVGCPLALLMRLGQGSKSHVIAVVFFALGVSLFGHFKEPIVNLLSPLTLEARTITRTQSGENLSSIQKPLSFTLQTIDGGKINYEQKGGVSFFRYQQKGAEEQIFKNSPLLIYAAPSCCPFCHPEAIGFLKDLEKDFAKKGLVSVGIFRDHSIEDMIMPFIKRYGISWILARDPEYTLLKKFGVTPETFFTVVLIDRKGAIRLKQEGFSKTDKEKFQQEIELLVGKMKENAIE
jgi:peroxiredoxin